VFSPVAMADDFEAIVAEGMRYYGEGNYDAAIEKFFKAKLLRDEPELIYNIARSDDKKGDCNAAKRHYEMFVKRKDAPKPTAEETQGYADPLGECPTTRTMTYAWTPAVALVSANGNPHGVCGQYKLGEGSYALIVTAEGIKPADRRVEIKAGGT